MSHEYHGADPVGTYNPNCPDCNHPWRQAVSSIMGLHFPFRMGNHVQTTVCNHCSNQVGDGDVKWPCPTWNRLSHVLSTTQLYSAIPQERYQEFRNFYGVDIDGYPRSGSGTSQGDYPPQEDVAVLRRDSGVRTVSEPASGDGASGMPEGLLSPSVPPVLHRGRHTLEGGDGPNGSGSSGTPSSAEGAMGSPADVAKPQLIRCDARRRPSSPEKCDTYLIRQSGWWICIFHGARDQVQ